MEVRPYVPADFLAIDLDGAELLGRTQANAEGLAASTEAYTATVDGRVVAVIGLVQLWPGRRYVWAYLSRDSGPHMLALTRRVRRWLRYHGSGRLEAAVDPEFAAANRWARLLGFRCETPEGMREYVPGKDFLLYARIG